MDNYSINTHLEGEFEWMNGRPIFLSFSGGKDSTATALLLKKKGIKFTPVFSDTGWEHPETYRYIKEVIEPFFGKVQRIRNEKYFQEDEDWQKGFEQAVFYYKIFPNHFIRFCTKELKTKPLLNFYSNAFSDTRKKPVACLGIRAQESRARSKQLLIEEKDEATIFRPILNWSKEDVISIHKEYNLLPNPLYLKGLHRVGCFPCIYANKKEIRLFENLYPERIEYLANLEDKLKKLNDDRGRAKTHNFFPSRRRDKKPMTVREIVNWAKRNTRGELYDDEEKLQDEGCLSWGLCETLVNKGEQLELFQIEEPNLSKGKKKKGY